MAAPSPAGDAVPLHKFRTVMRMRPWSAQYGHRLSRAA